MTVATEAAMAQQPVSAQVVGNAFVQQYYNIQHQSPGLVHRFYQDISKLGRPDDDGTMSTTTTMHAIDEKILSLKYGEFRAEIKSVDAQESYNGGVHVLVTGYLVGKDNMIRNFTQSFFLAPQEKGYFVLNDIFRYVEDIKHRNEEHRSVNEVEAPLTPEQNPPPVQEIHITEETLVTVEVNGEEAVNGSINGDVSVVEEEVPVAEVVDEVPDDSNVVVESHSKIEEVPKKSYASVVMVMKESAMPLSSPSPVPRRSLAKSQEQPVNLAQALALALVPEAPVSSVDPIENGDNQGSEADGYSIYIRGLPMNATSALLEDEFKQFGPIKIDGIQVRSNKQQGFCFGFVEFEVESSVQKAIEASPVTIGGRQAFVEEKKSTNSRGKLSNSNRGRFPGGRGSGFRNEGMRGRGNYVSGRVYTRDFSGKTEFGNRGSNRGGFSNRGGDGYQRSDNMGSIGGRSNRGGGIVVNGTPKPAAPRMSATS
ncbi:nuclear transport factor 2 (NTF2) family protein with RNA binding (RRM-RBD-RNP motifs) domain-containing protein [Actinidia rufa]|uniref:Nuclear transport factor 2 (NTF2) family protein with RNA binding (RRM-RBD-RNP motifs) domain-containing protein n=2 Tax=Actinidia rufa TaxID=165716 RepID=A0A7J0FTF4_9ERIC|nr:nuclear transport factor 2 (NTF2) family protein with RNA binding (RRM-RBD-RNP motifs) domain-containing protein [Actinidia rufa]